MESQRWLGDEGGCGCAWLCKVGVSTDTGLLVLGAGKRAGVTLFSCSTLMGGSVSVAPGSCCSGWKLTDVPPTPAPFQFPDIVEFSETMANAGKTVIVAALDGTFQRKVRHLIQALEGIWREGRAWEGQGQPCEPLLSMQCYLDDPGLTPGGALSRAVS